jgi:type I restriction enzyme S subunit
MAGKGDINKGEIQPEFSVNWIVIPFEKALEKTSIAHKLKSIDFSTEGLYPVVDQGANLIAGFIDDDSKLYTGELPITVFGDHTRNIKYIDFKFAVGADGTKILKAKRGINEKFLHFYLSSLSIPDFGYSRHYSIFKELDFPLPPLAEQERIVAKLDALFTQHEIMQKALQRIPQLLKNFRQQVLTQAVTGKLTEKWRKGKELIPYTYEILDSNRRDLKLKNNKKYKNAVKVEFKENTKGIKELFPIPKSWLWVNLDQVTWNISDGPHYSPKYVDLDKGKRFISMRNINSKGIDFDDCKHVSIDDHNEFIKRGKPETGDILYTKGGSTGIACSIDEDADFSYWVHVALLKPIKNVVNSVFFRNILNSNFCYVQSQAFTHGVGNQDLGLTRMIYITFPLPPFQEQNEIVARIESLFAKADTIEDRYQILKQKIASLPQAILHKAFKGELTPQLPTDGDANDLLAEILALKKEVKKVKNK